MTDEDPASDTYGGFTLDELGDYLDADRTPRDPAIESSPEAVATLERLAELRVATHDLIEREAVVGRHDDERWIGGVLQAIRLVANAGRDLPMCDGAGLPIPGLFVTEGALRGVVRDAADDVHGVTVRRTRFVGDVTAPGAVIDVEVVVVVRTDRSIPERAAELRERVADALVPHAPFVVGSVTVRVADVEPDEAGRVRNATGEKTA